MEFTSQLVKTDVTAVKIFKNVTFVGIGATFHIFCNESNKLINKFNILGTRGEHIFGIVPFTQDKILLFCGSFLLLFTVNQSYDIIEEISRATLQDWILDAKLIVNETKIATVSMQNKMQIWDTDLNLKEAFECKERCILYSAHICYETYNKLIVLSGTVFNEILIWKCAKDESQYVPVLKRLQKHKGVIFSLQYSEQNGLICSTSDDRSAVLWKVKNGDLYSELNKESVDIVLLCQVYGHFSRVFQCLILDNCFITGGEDSLINIWSLDGKLKRKLETNQGSAIWALDYNKNKDLLVTGGGNGGVYAFSLNTVIKEERIQLPERENPKLISILASKNIVAFSESGVLYVNTNKEWKIIQYFDDLKNYVIFKLSKCRKLVSLAGIKGQLYIYKENDGVLQKMCTFQTKPATRIISLHWLSCDLLLICQEEGKLTLLGVKKSEVHPISSFILPYNSQRCITSATIFNKNIVVGDRKGNVHMYKIGETIPVQSIPKVHSHLGVTNLLVESNNLISLGRNSIIKVFSKNNDTLSLISSDKVPYSWLLDIIDNLLIAFSGDNFIIWNYQSKRILLEKICGGGHRSWDFFKHKNIITFIYIKDKVINKFEYDLNINKSYDLVEPFHLKEVNCMNIIKTVSQYILISGGEDTTLRITLTNNNLDSFKNSITLKSHLSSIRCITTHKLECNDTENYLILSAGGRSQIVCWTLEDLVCRENHSYYEVIDHEESENRIMDLCVVKVREKLVLFVACSDGFIKIFFIEKDGVFKLKHHKNIFYKLKCIFKIGNIRVFDKTVLVTLASDGYIVFWDIEDIFLDDTVKPCGIFSVHQSGINTFSKFQINSTSFLFLTAGDDNAVALNYFNFEINDQTLDVKIIDSFLDTGNHWAQITGSCIIKNYFLTASVDQRLILYKWKIENEKLVCETVSKYNSPVADLKGLLCFTDTDFDLFIYGLGVEFLKVLNK